MAQSGIRKPIPEELNDAESLLHIGSESRQASIMMLASLGPTCPPPEAYYDRAFQLGVNDPAVEQRARLEIGTFLAYCMRYREAIPHIRRAVELDPNDYKARFVMGKLNEDTRNFDAAYRDFAAAAHLVPTFSRLHLKSLWKACTNYCKE